MHLRHFRIRKGTVALPSGGGEEGPSLPTPSILCPAQRWTPPTPGPACARPPRAHGSGGLGGAEGVRSPRVIANSKEGRGESWWRRRGKVTILLGRQAIKTP